MQAQTASASATPNRQSQITRMSQYQARKASNQALRRIFPASNQIIRPRPRKLAYVCQSAGANPDLISKKKKSKTLPPSSLNSKRLQHSYLRAGGALSLSRPLPPASLVYQHQTIVHLF